MSSILDCLLSIGAFFCICPREQSQSSKIVATTSTNAESHELRSLNPAPQDETWTQGTSTLGDSTVQTILTTNFELSCVEVNLTEPIETPILQPDEKDTNIPKEREESNSGDSENQAISGQDVLEMVSYTFVELCHRGAKDATNQQAEQCTSYCL